MDKPKTRQDKKQNGTLTPMMVKYLEIKDQHQDCIVFFRLGDFYEMFFEDAETASVLLGLTLTGRECGLETRAPMCGIPHHASSGYIKKLIDKGFKVAICEQLTQPQKGAMVERGVVKIVTAGTYNDETFLDKSSNNYIASLYYSDDKSSISWCDITTGEFYTMTTDNRHEDVLAMINPREVIDSNGHYGYSFNSGSALMSILRYFKINNTEIFDIPKDSKMINSSGALLDYLLHTQKATLPNITKIQVVNGADFMILDKTARDNLEINHPLFNPGTKYGSLLSIIDHTATAMGARKIRLWLNRPLNNIAQIEERLEAVETFFNDTVTTKELVSVFSKIGDLSRLAGRVASKDATPRDFVAIAKGLEKLNEVKKILTRICPDKTGLLSTQNTNITLLPDVVDLIKRCIADSPPINLSDGGYIRDGYSTKLDEFRNAGTLGREWLSKLEQKEREECNLKELKISYNRVTGYYFEIPSRLSDKIPYRFTRRGTTANTERYITEELKDIQDKIINAESRAIELESKLLAELREALLDCIDEIQSNADTIAILDSLQSLAMVAVANNWIRPKLNQNGLIKIIDARHCVVEKIIGANNFIANDCEMKNNTMIITGPNMAGKSTYMRTVANIVILAHVGSFVPAKSADINLTDRVFTRIGASDKLLQGESTFMVEMNEVSNIVHNATKNSLVLLDEVGRGTGTRDGMALASAVITYITNKIGSNTMFATHFHGLSQLATNNPRIKNFKVLVEQIDGEIVFLHKLKPGIEQNSFGIDVAKLSGLPNEIIEEARRLLNEKY